jgi:RNA polymerase sigma-70 factor (ECF subfamily)
MKDAGAAGAYEKERHMNDAGIIALLFERSEKGLDELLRMYGRMMNGLAGRICGNENDAEEVVNDALIAVWKAIPPERPDPLSAYVLRIVRNLACKRVRQRSAGKRKAVVLPVDEFADLLSSSQDGESLADSAEITAALNAFLSSLSETDRRIFVRRYWYADGIAAIAGMSGLTKTAVSDRLAKMKRAFAALLARRGVGL